MFSSTNPTRPPETPTEEKPDWSFFGILVLVIVTLCGIPTAIAILGAWVIKAIWGL